MKSKQKTGTVSVSNEAENTPDETRGNPPKNRLRKLFASKKDGSDESPLLWLIGPSNISSGLKNYIQAVSQAPSRRPDVMGSPTEIERCTGVRDGHSALLEKSLRILADCYSIPSIDLALKSFYELDSQSLYSDSELQKENDLVSPLESQLSNVEVPLTLSFQFPDLENRRQIMEGCFESFATSIDELLDYDGWPTADCLCEFGPLSASWLRCHVLFNKMDFHLDFETSSKSEAMARNLIRMVRPDRTLAFSGMGAGHLTDTFLKTLRKIFSDPSDKSLAKIFTGKPKPLAVARGAEEPSLISQWSKSALLQSTWEPHSPMVAVDFSNRKCHMEISRDQLLIQGNPLPEISLDGELLPVTESFEIVCERCDDDLDYLELEMPLGSSAKLNRQILLSRTDEFLLVADLVIPTVSSCIEYRCQWPLVDHMEAMAELETREVYICSPEIQSLAIPLALPEWKLAPTRDRFEWHNGKLSLQQTVNGRGLYAPLVFDLNPGRSRCKRTWRQLTVGENRKIVDQDVGCAFRFQLDEQQWVFYRAISSTGNRTFMGENLNCEFVFDHLEKDGSLTQLIEIK